LEIKVQSLPFQQNMGFIGENTELVKSAILFSNPQKNI